MATKKTNGETDLVFADMVDEDDFSIDMSDVEEVTNELIPPGWYYCRIDNHYDRANKSEGGKIPVGTPGVNFEFTVLDGPCKNRKVFAGFWFHSTSSPYLKTLMLKSGSFEDVNAKMPKSQLIDTLEGSELWVKVTIRKGQKKPDGSYYDDSNDIREYKSSSEKKVPTLSDPFGD
jgi:hypothetical protein